MEQTPAKRPEISQVQPLHRTMISQQAFEQRTSKTIGDLVIDNTKSKILIDTLQAEVASLRKEAEASIAEIARLKAELLKAAESYKTLANKAS